MPEMVSGVQTCTMSRGLTQGRKQMQLRNAAQKPGSSSKSTDNKTKPKVKTKANKSTEYFL